MAYLGTPPQSGFITTAKQRVTSSTNAYVDLDHAISSIADVIVFVNFVKQDTTNLTLTTSTRITLGATLVSSDIVEIHYLGKAVNTQTPGTATVTNDMLAGSIALDKLSATGTKSSSTFLRGDNTFATAGISGVTSSSSSTALSIDANGHVTKPLQPAFYATVTGESRTGMDTESTMKYATEVFDINADYNNSTYTFTAPVTGKYQFNITLGISGFTSSNDIYIRLQTSNRNMDSRVKSARSNADMLYLSVLTDMDASDTALVRFRNYEDGSQEFYSDRSQFSGYLVC
jgi:hypothetical protein